METTVNCSRYSIGIRFLPYLWGMETRTFFRVCFVQLKFLPYLWGMETITSFFHTYTIAWFLPYLWGMETSKLQINVNYGCKVLTVPMRNGNWTIFHHHSTQTQFLPYLWGMETPAAPLSERRAPRFLPYLWGMETKTLTRTTGLKSSSYRTYEEWKLLENLLQQHKETVLTVPMRNGNPCSHI